jgi:hypothetical protein
MPITFAPFVGLALGGVLAWIAAPELAHGDGSVALSRSFAVVVAFTVLSWLPVVGYFVVFHGDWSYLYMVSWQRVPSAIDLGLVLLAGVAVVGGFWLSVGSVRKGRLGPIAAMVSTSAFVAISGVVAGAHRLAVSGTYAQFHGDFGTEPIAASTLGKGVLFMGAMLALEFAWAVRSLLTIGAEVRS